VNEDSAYFQPPPACLGQQDNDGLKIFKFYEHPKIRVPIEAMKTAFMWYQALTDSIKSFEERKDNKGKDTFDSSDWWKSNSGTLRGFTYVLREVLTNSPNSCPPERLFSIFNATYNDDQKSSYTDYIEYRCSRSLTNEPCSSRVSR
jgi:hypothetical protein